MTAELYRVEREVFINKLSSQTVIWSSLQEKCGRNIFEVAKNIQKMTKSDHMINDDLKRLLEKQSKQKTSNPFSTKYSSQNSMITSSPAKNITQALDTEIMPHGSIQITSVLAEDESLIPNTGRKSYNGTARV